MRIAGHDRVAADRRVRHRTRARQRHIRHAVLVDQAVRREFRARKGQRRAVGLAGVVRRDDEDQRRVHRQRAVAVTNVVIRQTSTQCGARDDRITADHRAAHTARAGQSHVGHVVAVQQSRDGELHRVQRRAISLVRIERGDQQARRVHGQRAVTEADAVIRQACSQHAACADCVAADGCVRSAACAAQGHIRHRVAVQQAGDGELRRVQRRAINLVRIHRGDEQARRVHRQRAVAVTDAVIREPDAKRAARVDRIAADRRVRLAAGAGEGHVRHAVTVQQTRRCKAGGQQRRAVNLVRVERGDEQAGGVHRQRPVAVADRVVRQTGA